MGRLVAMLIAVAVLTACGSSAASPGAVRASKAVHCGPGSAHTLAAGSRARVYSTHSAVYACTAGSRTQLRLGGSSSCQIRGRVLTAAVGGRDIAYGIETCGVDTGASQVVVRRLPSGHQLFDQPGAASPAGPEGFTTVTSIVVTSAGQTAWIAHSVSIVSHRSVTAVYARSGTGARQLDQGSGIGQTSLRLHGRTVTWQDSGQARTARLG
jgi:hypothetical protein